MGEESDIHEIRRKYADFVLDKDDDVVDWHKTDLHKELARETTPGVLLKDLREVHGWTQKELGEKIGGVPSTRICDWECEQRAISKEYAKKLEELFHVPVGRFI